MLTKLHDYLKVFWTLIGQILLFVLLLSLAAGAVFSLIAWMTLWEIKEWFHKFKDRWFT